MSVEGGYVRLGELNDFSDGNVSKLRVYSGTTCLVQFKHFKP